MFYQKSQAEQENHDDENDDHEVQSVHVCPRVSNKIDNHILQYNL